MSALGEAYARDGVVHIPGALDAEALDAAKAAYDWSLAHPGPLGGKIRQKSDATFYQDLYNPDCLAGYRPMLEAGTVVRSVSDMHHRGCRRGGAVHGSS